MGDSPALPIPISWISGHYFLFSADAATYLRREHNICGVLTGTLPQAPQQNIFLGLPLELMPEEARLLVEKKIAYIVDDVQLHSQTKDASTDENRLNYLRNIEQRGSQAALAMTMQKEQSREKYLKKEKNSKVAKSSRDSRQKTLLSAEGTNESGSSSPSVTSTTSWGVTPPDSLALFPNPPPLAEDHLPDVPSSYPLFAHLHSKGYSLSPGLRFGCQYMAYPGDPLRYHSHFLVVAFEWDEEIDLLDIVSGGRLGTAVKKGYLIGGEGPSSDQGRNGRNIRMFSIEWAGM